ncbi:Poly(A) RNA polymerase cid14 [Escovopsis weberi]|uniref:polynucleotide adenylyltransferase n=1 Tax=Escovopsis weberi TaxID=150374 RepID=A0A0N0RTI2_ESCWE|nr:Poly(A) RNA polymerase cid14 [Escovopsis weberi]
MAPNPNRAPGRRQERRRSEPDSWRPGDKSSASDHRRRSYNDQDHRGNDSYRPHVPQGDFTFRSEKPAGIADFHSQDNYYSGKRPSQPRNSRGRPLGRFGRPRWLGPPNPSERALISGNHSSLPEENLHNGEGAKFRDLDELSDDDELDMDISSQSETEGPAKKRARSSAPGDSATQAAKWSNPDPYTALPCPDDELRKKRDVVKLIRKARLEDASSKPGTSTEAENFLSFDLSDSDKEAEKDDADEDKDEDEASDTDVTEIPKPPTEPPPPLPRGAPPVGPASDRAGAGWPSSLPNKPDLTRDRQGPLGSRKRTIDDEIKPPDYGQLKKVNMSPPKGHLLSSWEPKKDEDPCPWATVDHSATNNLALRLHKEIMDFYDYVKPKKFEQTIRDSLVENLKKAMRRDGRNFASAQAFPFGSFKSGLYLPTADMDLVVCSASFIRGGPPTYLGARSWLYKFQKLLVAQQVAEQDSIEVIAHARIPLVKFVDRITGLKVDVSFENLGGVDAIKTFLRWKDQYPAMPILVTVIKHFLLMRGLNEPVNGGIGGYSVICLVVSMLQLMPQVQSRSLIPEHHLGEMLLEFLDLYGSKFNYEVNAISLSRPVGYIRKNEVSSFSYKNRDRLSIIDPNNSANDISGGSSNTDAILARFHEAHKALRRRMREVGKAPEDGSILEVIMRGDYSSFRQQRGYLKHLHEKYIGACTD